MGFFPAIDDSFVVSFHLSALKQTEALGCLWYLQSRYLNPPFSMGDFAASAHHPPLS
jgi:hypothetical protein